MSTEFLRRYADKTQDVLTTILSQSQDCIKLISLAGDVEYINGNGLRSLGYTDPEALLGLRWSALWPEENPQQIESAVESANRGQSTRFEAFCPTYDGHPRWWDVSVSPVGADDGEVTHLLAISRDVTGQVNTRLNDRLRREEAEREADFAGSVAREMRHRLKNLLAVIGAVAKLLSRHTEDGRELALKLEEKLISLARAQDILTLHGDEAIGARAAIEQILAASAAGERIELLSVPDVCLQHEAVQQLALILGELQTNALKHGALRCEEGRIKLSARATGNLLALSWHEDCAEEVERPETGNGGFQMISRLGSAMSHKAHIDWHSRGIIVDFFVRTAS